MKLILPLLLLLLLGASACIDKEFPDLPDNIFDDLGPPLFRIDNVAMLNRGTVLRQIQVDFTPLLDAIPADQRMQFERILLNTPTRTLRLALDRTRIVDGDYSVGQEVCYALAFTTRDMGTSRKTNFCVMVE